MWFLQRIVCLHLSEWVSIASICAVGAMSPGPSLAVVIQNTIHGGRIQGVMTGIGHAIGVGLYAITAIYGTALLFSEYPTTLVFIEIAGGSYLIWLGIQAFRNAGKGTLKIDDLSINNGFLDGFAISGLNPKIAVFFLALFGPIIPPEATNLERIGAASMALFIDGAWYVLFALALAKSGASQWLAKQGKLVDTFLAILLTTVGVWLIFNHSG